MDRSEGTHVAVGAALLGAGGVALSILIPLAAAAKRHPWGAGWFLIPACIAGVLGLTGLYMLLAVYAGWPLPTTAGGRQARAELSAVAALQREGVRLLLGVPWLTEVEGHHDLDEYTNLINDWDDRVLAGIPEHWLGVYQSGATKMLVITQDYERASRLRNAIETRLDRLSQVVRAMGGGS